MRVPDAENESLLSLSEPVGHDGDDPGPSRRLESPADDLHNDEVGDRVDAHVLGGAEEEREQAGHEHSARQKVAEVDAFRHETAEKGK